MLVGSAGDFETSFLSTMRRYDTHLGPRRLIDHAIPPCAAPIYLNRARPRRDGRSNTHLARAARVDQNRPGSRRLVCRKTSSDRRCASFGRHHLGWRVRPYFDETSSWSAVRSDDLQYRTALDSSKPTRTTITRKRPCTAFFCDTKPDTKRRNSTSQKWRKS
jgi:hypothetical protein